MRFGLQLNIFKTIRPPLQITILATASGYLIRGIVIIVNIAIVILLKVIFNAILINIVFFRRHCLASIIVLLNIVILLSIVILLNRAS